MGRLEEVDVGANSCITKENFRRALEIFSGDNLIDWRNPPEEFAVSSEKIVKLVLESIFSANAFDFAIIAASKIRGINIFNRNELPSFCLSERLAQKQLSSFVNHALKGNKLIISTTCEFENISHVFERHGWEVSSENEQDIFDNINRNWQQEAVSIASRFCGGGVLFFNHDADPIYFLERGSSEIKTVS